MCRFVFSILLLFFPLSVFGESEVYVLSFQELSSLSEQHESHLHNQYIAMRGFVYRDEESGRCFLASKPHFRCCCCEGMRSSPQVVLPQEFLDESGGDPVTLKGKFVVDVVKDGGGELSPFYRLEDVEVVKESSAQLPVFSFAIAGIFVLGCLLAVLKKMWGV